VARLTKEQKEVLQSQLDEEKELIRRLKLVYGQAQDDCVNKIIDLARRRDMENLQTIIYQKQYQEVLKKQLDTILDQLHTNEFSSISEYLTKCYEEGFIGTMYDIAGQGIPFIIPIDQKQVVRAVQLDSKLKESLYKSLGEDVTELKKAVRIEVARGIANGSSWLDVGEKLSKNMKHTPFNKAINNSIRIARTEGHRIQNQAALDAQYKAKEKGADVVKQWDSTLDGKTRYTHRLLDGQLRELEEPFEVSGKKADAPGLFGDPGEDCNCRCALLQRTRWALDDDELQALREKAAFHGVLVDDSKEYGHAKAKDFSDYFNKYKQGAESVRSGSQKINKMAVSTNIKNDWSKTTPRLVSKEEKQQISEYAESKGIHIHDISKFDGDSKILKSEIDVLSKLKNEYSISKNITVTVSGNLSDDDFAIRTNSTITFNAKALRDRSITEINIKSGGNFASTKVEDIAAHEFGHIIASIKGNKGVEITQQAYYNIYNKSISIDEALEYLENNISLYATTYTGNKKDIRFHTKFYSEIISEVLAKNNSNANEFTKEFVRLLKGGAT